MVQAIDIFHTEDGFFVGRQCKNGKPAKGAYKLTGGDIMTMFSKFFTDYCADTNNDKLVMADENGNMFVTMKVPAKAGEAKE